MANTPVLNFTCYPGMELSPSRPSSTRPVRGTWSKRIEYRTNRFMGATHDLDAILNLAPGLAFFAAFILTLWKTRPCMGLAAAIYLGGMFTMTVSYFRFWLYIV